MKKRALGVILGLFLSVSLTVNSSNAGVMGDTNGDGVVNIAEALYALQISAGLHPHLPESCVITGFGDWAASTDYNICDVVQHNGSFYICTQDHSSSALNEPDVNEFWVALGLTSADLLELQQAVASQQDQLDLLQFKFDARNPSNSLHGMIADHSYRFYSTAEGIEGENLSSHLKWVGLVMVNITGTITFANDGTLIVNISETEINAPTEASNCYEWNQEDPPACIQYYVPIKKTTESGSIEGSWTVNENTGQVSISVDGNPLPFQSSYDGSMLTFLEINDDDKGDNIRGIDTQQFILIRLPNRPPVIAAGQEFGHCSGGGCAPWQLVYDTPDADGDTAFRFAITEGQYASEFSIDVNTGIITETGDPPCDKTFTITVEMTDGKLNGTTEADVDIYTGGCPGGTVMR